MSDFVTRLAERAMGTSPIVRPLIASMFAPEPASHLMEPEVPERMPRPQTPPDTPTLVPDQAELEDAELENEEPDTSATPQSSAPDAASPAPPEPSRHAPTSGQEDLDAPATPGPPRRQRDAGEAGPLETGMESRQEVRQNLSAPGSRPLRSGETLERAVVAERDPSRATEEAPRRLVPEGSTSDSFTAEDGPGRVMLGPTLALAELARVTTEAPAPPSGADDPLNTGEETPAPEIIPTHRAAQGAAPVIVPRIVRHQPGQRQESSPPESQVLAPEPPAPTIKVAIGRIEVRAVTPPAPAQRETPARPGPLLSLDDYLEQRNGGHR